MKKDLYRDYATEAFRTYARLGCPTGKIDTEDAPLAADVAAVQRTLRYFERDGREGIAAAVRAYTLPPPGWRSASGISARAWSGLRRSFMYQFLPCIVG